MAVGADDIALLDLGEDVVPRTFTQPFADAELFFSQVVELQDERIALSAIHAWMLAKERDEVGGALGDNPLRATAGRIDVALLVTGISPPREFVWLFLLLAALAESHAAI